MSYSRKGVITSICDDIIILEDDSEVINEDNLPFRIGDILFEGKDKLIFGMIPNTNEEILEEMYKFPNSTRLNIGKIYQKTHDYLRNNKNYIRIDKNKVLANYFNRISWKDFSKGSNGEDLYHHLGENIGKDVCKSFLEEWRKFHLFRLFGLLGFSEIQTKIIIEEFAICDKVNDIEDVILQITKYPTRVLYLHKEIDLYTVARFRKRMCQSEFHPGVENIKKTLFYSESSYINVDTKMMNLLGNEKLRLPMHGLKLFDEGKKICLTSTFKREEYVVAPLIKKISMCKLEWDNKILIRDAFLTEEQKSAIAMVMKNPISIITGGPGTGKTRVIHSIIREAKQRKIRYHVGAFTGKAIGRVIETSYPETIEASTIDMMIVRGPEFYKFNLLILEEVSMISTNLIYRLFQKFNPHIFKIVLVGDINQIPPLEKGNFFSSLFNCSYIPKTILEKNFRVDQEYGGDIVRNARLLVYPHRDLKVPPELDTRSKSFNIIRGGKLTLRTILNSIHDKGLNVTDLTILTPYNEDVKWINRSFQRIIYHQKEGNWHVNDRIMIIKNVTKSDLANGDLGWVTEINDNSLKVVLDKNIEKEEIEVDYDIVTHAYAFTINKSQGSEYDTVILYIPDNRNNDFFLNLNLIYTAITRAKKMVWVIAENPDQFYAGCNRKNKVSKDIIRYLINKKYPEPSSDIEEPSDCDDCEYEDSDLEGYF